MIAAFIQLLKKPKLRKCVSKPALEPSVVYFRQIHSVIKAVRSRTLWAITPLQGRNSCKPTSWENHTFIGESSEGFTPVETRVGSLSCSNRNRQHDRFRQGRVGRTCNERIGKKNYFSINTEAICAHTRDDSWLNGCLSVLIPIA